MGTEEIQVDGDKNVSFISDNIFLEDVSRSASTWAQPTQGKAMFVKDCCLKDCTVLGQRRKGASCN